MKYIDADRLKAEIEVQRDLFIGHAAILKKTVATDGFDIVIKIIDSLQQEPIEKDEDAEKLILCDILEATVARINGGKVDKEKEENIMMEKITYLRNLGLNAKEK